MQLQDPSPALTGTSTLLLRHTRNRTRRGRFAARGPVPFVLSAAGAAACGRGWGWTRAERDGGGARAVRRASAQAGRVFGCRRRIERDGRRIERDGSSGAGGTSAKPRPLCGPRTRPACVCIRFAARGPVPFPFSDREVEARRVGERSRSVWVCDGLLVEVGVGR